MLDCIVRVLSFVTCSHTASQSDCAFSHSQQQLMSIPIALHPYQDLMLALQMLAILILSNFTFTFHFHVLEKELATHSSVLAWRIPGTGSLVGCVVQSMWSHRVGHD